MNTQHPSCKSVSPLNIPWSILFLFTQILSSSTTNLHIISSPISLPRHWEKSFSSPPPLWSPGPRCSHLLVSLVSPCPGHQWVSNSIPQKSQSDPTRGWVTSRHTTAPNSPHFIQIKSHHHYCSLTHHPHSHLAPLVLLHLGCVWRTPTSESMHLRSLCLVHCSSRNLSNSLLHSFRTSFKLYLFPVMIIFKVAKSPLTSTPLSNSQYILLT